MYQLDDVRVIRDGRTILQIDKLKIDPHAFTIVLGHNGSGKSTLVNILAGEFPPDSGTVQLMGVPLSTYGAKKLAQKVAYLPQKLPELAGMTVQELVRLGRYPWRGVFGRWRAEDDDIINDAMSRAGVEAFRDNLADQLSGGERQRAWIAMLLAQQAELLILDEPTSALDIHHQYQLMGLLSELNRTTGKGVIVILHDLNLALRYATHVIALKQGRLAFHGGLDTLLDQQRLTDLYATEVRLIDHPQLPHKVAIVC